MHAPTHGMPAASPLTAHAAGPVARAAQQEAQRAKQAVGRVDPTVNLAADAGERFTAGSGYGSLHDAASDPAAATRRVNLDLIARDINRHAAVVLEGVADGLGDAVASSAGGDYQYTGPIAAALAAQQKQAAAAAVGGSAGLESSRDADVSPTRLREWQQRAASALEDLSLDDRASQYAPLNIQDPRAYFDSGAAAAGDAAGGGKPGNTQQQQQQQQAASPPFAAAGAGALQAALDAIDALSLPDPPCDPGAAAQVLLELSQGQDEGLVDEFGPVAATALQYPPTDPTHGLPGLLIVSEPGPTGQAAGHACCLGARHSGAPCMLTWRPPWPCPPCLPAHRSTCAVRP